MAAFTTINIVSPLTAFGLQAFWLKVFGREGWHAMRWIRPTFVFCLLSTVLTMLGVAAWALLGLGMEDRVAWCLLILSTNLLSVASIEVVTTRFLLEEKPLPLMVWQTLPQVVRFLVVVGVLMATTTPDAVTVAWLYAFVGGGLALASVPSMMALARGRMHMVGHQKPGAISLDVRPGVLAVAKETWAFGIGNLFFLVYFQSSVIFISHYLGAEATGTFGVAVTLLAALYLPTTVYQKLLMPRLHRWAYQDPIAFAVPITAATSTCCCWAWLLPSVRRCLLSPWCRCCLGRSMSKLLGCWPGWLPVFPCGSFRRVQVQF